MRLYVFDDAVADAWAPFALTRPCCELLFGTSLLRERLERRLGAPVDGILTRPWLSEFREPGTPPVLGAEALDEAGERFFLSSRFVPEALLPEPVGEATTYQVEGQTVGARFSAGTPAPDPEWLARPAPLPGVDEAELPGSVLQNAWDLVERNPTRLLADLREAVGANGRPGRRSGAPGVATSLPPGTHRIGEEPVLLGEGVRIEPGVIFDTRGGPIRLDREVEVLGGARLGGPLHAGAGSRLLGGPVEVLSAGPYSYLRGEIEASVVLGHANKAHDGFLGHAYLGRWVNLGAMTTNSDLKNNYSTVRIGPPDRRVDSGLLKLGCLLGDHVKTGIGLMLPTGSIVGAGSNLVGDGSPPAWVPPFSWGFGPNASVHREAAFLRTAATVMTRRGIEPDAGVRRWLGAVWAAGTGETT